MRIMVSKTRSEDTLVFLAVTPEITKMSKVYEALEEFFKVKKESDPSDRFNIILFQQEGPNYLNDFTLYPDNIMIALKSLEPMVTRANIAGGIFVAITFIIEVFQKISEKTFRLIILTDSGSLRMPDQYIPVLDNLIDKVKEFPFFIDVVRLDVDDPREDLKLMKLARRCNGDIHEINDVRALSSILEVLAIKREIRAMATIEDKGRMISEENQPFFESWAKKPIKLETEETCSICFQKNPQGLVQCPSCSAIAHKSCWSQWARNSNIGLIHVFRCHNCYALLTLDEKYVFAILTGETPPEDVIKIEEKNYQEYLESLEEKGGPTIVSVEDSLPVSIEESDGMDTDLSFDIQFDDEEEFEVELDKVMDEEFRTLKDDDLRIIWCDGCGKVSTNEYKKCPYCGAPL